MGSRFTQEVAAVLAVVVGCVARADRGAVALRAQVDQLAAAIRDEERRRMASMAKG